MAQQKQFVQSVYETGLRAGLSDHVARLAASQAALETGYGKSVKGNNYFGIKAGSSWNGGTQNLKTWEEVNGKRVNITDKFRSYATPEESLLDWSKLVERRFPAVLQADNFKDAAKGLKYGKAGGYATDSKYGSKLSYIESKFLGGSASPIGKGMDAISGIAQANGAGAPATYPLKQILGNPSYTTPIPRPVQGNTPARPISKTPQYNSLMAFDQGGILDPRPVSFVSSAQAAPMPMGPVAQSAFQQPHRPVTPTSQPSLAAQYASYGAGKGTPIQAPPMQQSRAIAPSPKVAQPSLLSGQYDQYQSPKPQVYRPPTPAPIAPIAPIGGGIMNEIDPPQNQFPKAPRKPIDIGAGMGGILGSVGGGMIGGPVGSILAGMIGKELGGKMNLQMNVPSLNLGGLLSGIGAQPFNGQLSYLNPQNYGGGSRTSDYVQSGRAPAGSAYRDSGGGRSVSYGNGYSERTDKYGGTTITTPEGKTARKI